MKINIFYGPNTEFNKIKPSDDFLILNQFVKLLDYNQNIEIKNTYKYLVVNSENYSGITESALQNFISIISMGNFDEIFLQNPPRNIKQLLEKSFDNIIELNHEYNKLGKEQFLKINNEFDDRIIGQKEVKNALLNVLFPIIKDYNNNKPTCILFYGISGVGKTETAKFLSEVLEEKLFRKQLSMFQNNKFSEYLFGGNHMQSSFARDLLERESNIILLDEFDKAASIFHEAFYQLFDEGVYEDPNYTVKLDNSIIICTSNYINSEDIRKNIGDPLFFRFDKIIPFKKLDKESIEKIIIKTIHERYNELNSEDQNLINKNDLINYFNKYSKKLINTRQISKLINEKINEILVKKFLYKNNRKE